MKSTITSVLFLIICQVSYAQYAADSLRRAAEKTDSPKAKSSLFNELVAGYMGNNRDSAQKYIDSALIYSLKVEDKFWQAEVAMTYADLNQHNLLIDTLASIADAYVNNPLIHEDTSKWIKALISYGAYYANKGMYMKGMPLYLEGSELAMLRGDFEDAGKLQYNIASIYYNIGMIEESASFFEKAVEYFELAPNLSFKLIAMSGLGNVYAETENIDKAIQIGSNMLKISDSLEYTKGQVSAYALLTSAYGKNKQFDISLDYAQKALPYAEKYGSGMSLSNAHNNLGIAYHENELHGKSIKHFEKALTYPVMQKNPLSKHYIYKPLGYSLMASGQYEKAARILKEYIEYQDTVIGKENKLLISDLEKKYDNAKKETQIEVQKNEILQNTKDQNNLIYSILAVSVLATIIIGILMYRRKKDRIIQEKEVALKENLINNLKKEKEILSLTAMLKGQETERKRIAQDLHDGLGGLLASVKTRIAHIEEEIKQLEIQNLYGKTNELIDKACSEVRRISQNLMPTTLRLYGLPDAIEQLVHDKTTTYKATFQYEKLGDDTIRYEESHEVFLYRIIQEGLNNAIKHANASNIFLQIGTYPAYINIIIEDDGDGFEIDKINAGIGLHSIRSRVEFLKGNLDIRSKTNQGTCISIHIPVTLS